MLWLVTNTSKCGSSWRKQGTHAKGHLSSRLKYLFKWPESWIQSFFREFYWEQWLQFQRLCESITISACVTGTVEVIRKRRIKCADWNFCSSYKARKYEWPKSTVQIEFCRLTKSRIIDTTPRVDQRTIVYQWSICQPRSVHYIVKSMLRAWETGRWTSAHVYLKLGSIIALRQ